MPHSFPTPTHCRNGLKESGLLAYSLKKWKPVRDVLDLNDKGESIFTRKKPLCDKTLERIYAGLIKFVAGGKEAFQSRLNSTNVVCQNDNGKTKVNFLSKQFSGSPDSKNQSLDKPAGTITTIDHHAFVTAYYSHGGTHSINGPSPTITTKDRLALSTVQFYQNEYSSGTPFSSLETASPTITSVPKQKLVSVEQYLMNPQYQSAGASIEKPCFTLIARMDKMPPYLVTTENGDCGIAVFDTDTPMMIKIKEFMALYSIVDIKMRMLNISELKRIMGFPETYKLVGTQAEQKKFIGNAVEVNMSRVMCEALSSKINSTN